MTPFERQPAADGFGLTKRCPKIRGFAAVCVLLAALLPVRAPAQAGAANEPAVPAAADRLVTLNERFQVLLRQLEPFQIPSREELAAQPAATTEAELTARVDRLFVATAAEAAGRYRAYEDHLRELIDQRVQVEALKVDQSKQEQDLASAPDRLKAAEAQRERARARADQAEHDAAVLRDNAARIEEDFLQARATALGAVYYLLPTGQRTAFHETARAAASAPAYARLPALDPDTFAPRRPAPAKPVPTVKETTAAVLTPPPFPGSLEEKLAAFEDKQRALGYLAGLLPPQEKLLAAARDQTAAQRQQNDALAVRLREFDEPLAQARTAAAAAEERGLPAEVNARTHAGNLLRLATAALMWNHLKQTMVAPALEKFLEDNHQPATQRGLALVDAINQAPENFLPKGGSFPNPSRLLAVQERILDVEASLEIHAQAAADALGRGEISGGDELAARVFAGLDQTGRQVLRGVAGTMEGAQGNLARALLARAPAAGS